MTAFFIDDEGEAWPITSWLDANGDECDETETRVMVCGRDDKWFAIEVAGIEPPTFH